MDPKLIATLQLAEVFEAVVSNWYHGERAVVRIEWPGDPVPFVYTEQDVASGQADMAFEILSDLAHVLRSLEPE